MCGCRGTKAPYVVFMMDTILGMEVLVTVECTCPPDDEEEE